MEKNVFFMKTVAFLARNYAARMCAVSKPLAKRRWSSWASSSLGSPAVTRVKTHFGAHARKRDGSVRHGGRQPRGQDDG